MQLVQIFFEPAGACRQEHHARIEQQGPPEEILQRPATAFVASFVQGNNLFRGHIKEVLAGAVSIETPVGRLSGGNQQKVVIGRWLARAPKVLILDEPTRGVDVGARVEIHRLIRDLAGKGMAVLVISSEPDELPDLCDRVLVMAEGRIVREIEGEALSRSAIIEASYAAAGTPLEVLG